MHPLLYLCIVSLPLLQSHLVLPLSGLPIGDRMTQEVFSVKDTRQQLEVHYSYVEGRKIAAKNKGVVVVKKSFTLQNNTDKAQKFTFLHSSKFTMSPRAGVLKPKESLKVEYSFPLAEPSSDILFGAIYVRNDAGGGRPVLELRTSWKPPFDLKQRRLTFSELGDKEVKQKEIPLNVPFKELDQAELTVNSTVEWLDQAIVDRAGHATLKITTNEKNGFGIGLIDFRHKPTGHHQHLYVDARRKTRIRAIPPVVFQNPVSKKHSTVSVFLRDHRAKPFKGKIEAEGVKFEVIDQTSLGKDLLVELKLNSVELPKKKIKFQFEGYPDVAIPLLRGFQLDQSQPIFEFENINAAEILQDAIVKTQLPLWPRKTSTQQTYGYGPFAEVPMKKGVATEMTYRWNLSEHPNGDFIEETMRNGTLSGGEKYSSEQTWISVGGKYVVYTHAKAGKVNSSRAPLRNPYYRPLDSPFFSRSFDELINGKLKNTTILWEKPSLRIDKSGAVLIMKGDVSSYQKPPTFRYELTFDPENYLALVSAKNYRIKTNQLVNECNVREWLTKPGLFGIPKSSVRQSYNEAGRVVTIRRTQLLGAMFYNNSSFRGEVSLSDKQTLLESQSTKQK